MTGQSESTHRHASARTVLRNTSVQVVGEGLSKVASLALYVVIARAVGPAVFGNLVLALSVALLMTVIAGFGIEGMLVRNVARDRHTAGRLLTDAVSVKVVFGTLGVTAAVLVGIAGGYDGNVQRAIFVLAVAAVLDLIAKSYYAVFQALDDMRPGASCLVLQRSATAAIGIVLALLHADVDVIALAFLVGSILALATAVPWLARRGVTAANRPTVGGAREMVKSSFALGVSNAFNTVVFRVDALMLSLMKGSVATGLYGAVYRVLESTLFVTYAFTNAAAPTLARLERDSEPPLARAYELGIKALMVALVPIGDVFFAFPHTIVTAVYGQKYEDAEVILRLLGGAAVVYGIGHLSAYLLVVHHRDRVLLWTHCGLAIQNVALNLILIPTMSYRGAALATTISETSRAGILGWTSIRIAGPIRYLRVIAGPLCGTAGIAVVAIAFGGGLLALAAALVVYAGLLFAVERAAFPADVAVVRRALARRRGGELATSSG